jgi:hypothetical protein
MSKKRRFGRVRRLPSGRWQVRYAGPDGIDRPADETFTNKSDADVWLTLKEAEIRRGDWIDPDAGQIPFGKYALRGSATRCSSRGPMSCTEACSRTTSR